MIAGGAVGDILAAPKPTLRKHGIEVARVGAHQMRKHLALELAGQVRAGRRRSDKELRKIAAFNRQS